jgi:hypothetical protein
MSEPSNNGGLPRWAVGAVVALLAFQVGLLWMQGSMLERQHGDLQSLRQDVQDLSDSLDQFTGSFDQEDSGDGYLRPSRHRIRHRAPGLVRVQDKEGGEGEGVKKELEEQRKSEKDAVAKARDVREKLSIEENARKAEEKAKLEAESHKYRPLIWGGVVVALAALFLRSWMRNRA